MKRTGFRADFSILQAMTTLFVLLAAGGIANLQTYDLFRHLHGGADLLDEMQVIQLHQQNFQLRKIYLTVAWMIMLTIHLFTVRKLKIERSNYYIPFLLSAAWYYLVRWHYLDLWWMEIQNRLFGFSMLSFFISIGLAFLLAALLFNWSIRLSFLDEDPDAHPEILDADL